MEDEVGEIKTLYYNPEDGAYYCPLHGTQRMAKGQYMDPTTDEFGSEYDMRNTLCPDCYPD